MKRRIQEIRAINADERGITLIELLIYALLLSFVVAIAGGMIFGAVTAAKTVTGMTQNSTNGQLVADSVVTGIRNSSDFQLSTPVGNDQLLIARRASSGATINWSCVAWYYSAADKSVRYKISASPFLAPTAGELATWTLLANNVQPVSGTAIFSALNERLSMSILGLDGVHRPIDISTSATSRAGASGSMTCF
ncbi:MAG: prepilin-type N-terminal cleavage/methylation domain-containing protein [Terrimesophilobacter sp.]